MTQDSKAVPPCTLVVLSGLPSQSELFRGSVCALGNSIRDDPLGGSSGERSAKSRAKNSRSAGQTAPGDATRVSYTTPLIVRKIDPKTHKESRQRDVITAIHTGTCACAVVGYVVLWWCCGGVVGLFALIAVTVPRLWSYLSFDTLKALDFPAQASSPPTLATATSTGSCARAPPGASTTTAP